MEWQHQRIWAHLFWCTKTACSLTHTHTHTRTHTLFHYLCRRPTSWLAWTYNRRIVHRVFLLSLWPVGMLAQCCCWFSWMNGPGGDAQTLLSPPSPPAQPSGSVLAGWQVRRWNVKKGLAYVSWFGTFVSLPCLKLIAPSGVHHASLNIPKSCELGIKNAHLRFV